MIRSFRDSLTERFAGGESVPRFRSFERVAYRKIKYLRVPPGNQLEALKGDRQGQHSIRINDQWRICFLWSENGAEQVEIVDYH